MQELYVLLASVTSLQLLELIASSLSHNVGPFFRMAIKGRKWSILPGASPSRSPTTLSLGTYMYVLHTCQDVCFGCTAILDFTLVPSSAVGYFNPFPFFHTFKFFPDGSTNWGSDIYILAYGNSSHFNHHTSLFDFLPSISLFPFFYSASIHEIFPKVGS